LGPPEPRGSSLPGSSSRPWSSPAPGSLCLEVTEGAVIHDLEETLPTLRALAAIGIRLALDDFGTGYSSLAYLQQMPVQVLEVDRSFVAALGGEAGSTAIVRAVVDLAHQLGLVVTAEGIETPEQLEVLSSLACETGQGSCTDALRRPTRSAAAWCGSVSHSASRYRGREARSAAASADGPHVSGVRNTWPARTSTGARADGPHPRPTCAPCAPCTWTAVTTARAHHDPLRQTRPHRHRLRQRRRPGQAQIMRVRLPWSDGLRRL
jgi:hypothetical protein